MAASGEFSRAQPAQRSRVIVSRLPDDPAVPVRRRRAARLRWVAFRPADQLVEGIDHSGRMRGPQVVPFRVAKRGKVQQHGDAVAGLGCHCESFQYELIAKTPAVRRIGDDVLGARRRLAQEVDTALAKVALDQVGGDHPVPCRLQHLTDVALTASRLPNGTIKRFHGQKSLRRLGRRRIEFERCPHGMHASMSCCRFHGHHVKVDL